MVEGEGPPTDDWRWDETLFLGSAPYYARGRLPYPAGLSDALRDAMELDGHGRAIDVGCGPGLIALRIAHLFEEVVGLDPDAGMIAEAKRLAAEHGVKNARWVRMRAEELPAGLGEFRVATFGASFHWMDRDLVAATILQMLEPGGAFVHVDAFHYREKIEGDEPLPHPEPPHDAIRELIREYLGPKRRAGQTTREVFPSGEEIVLGRAGFEAPQRVRITGSETIVRTPDDVLAHHLSSSSSAPHLFGDRLAQFEGDVRQILADSSPSGRFAERTGDTELIIYRKPRD